MQAEFIHQDPGSLRPCNDPTLTPEEFLQAVMHDDLCSMALRIRAAKALADIHSKAPVPPITIRLRDPVCYEYQPRFPVAEGTRAGQHKFAVKICDRE
jgi:hypothetical protein